MRGIVENRGDQEREAFVNRLRRNLANIKAENTFGRTCYLCLDGGREGMVAVRYFEQVGEGFAQTTRYVHKDCCDDATSEDLFFGHT